MRYLLAITKTIREKIDLQCFIFEVSRSTTSLVMSDMMAERENEKEGYQVSISGKSQPPRYEHGEGISSSEET